MLINGDCLVEMNFIQSESIDMVLVDPPYGTTNCKWDSIIDFTKMWSEVERIIKPNGAILIFGQNPYTANLIMSNPKLYRYCWIWEKTAATGHLNAKRAPMRSHENISVFYKKLPIYNPQKTQGHSRKVSLNNDRSTDKTELYGDQKGIVDYDSTERYPRSVLKFSVDKQKENYHSTQKPVKLLEYFIKTYTNIESNPTILDFTMGSGSTGVACKNLNVNFIGIESDKDIFNVAENRIKLS